MKRHPSLAGLVALAIVLIGFLASVPAGAAYLPPPTVQAQVTGSGPYGAPRAGGSATLAITLTVPAVPTTGTTLTINWPWGGTPPATVTTTAGACRFSPVGGYGFGTLACAVAALPAGQVVHISATYTITAPAGAWHFVYIFAGRADACCNAAIPFRIIAP